MPNTKNFGYSTVLTAPSPASSGTSLVVQSADGLKFPSTPFNATVWPAGAQALSSNAEIVTVTNISTDTFTITRQAESSSARSIIVGDQIDASITAGLFPTGTIVGTTDSQTLTNKITSDTFMGKVFDTRITSQNTTLAASTDYLVDDFIEIGATHVFEIPATSTLEVVPTAKQVEIQSYFGIYDFIESGCVWSADSAGSSLNGTMTDGYVWINGRRLRVNAVRSRAFTASKDTYVDFSDAGNGTATVTYTETTNNLSTGSPTLAQGSLRNAIIVTAAGSIAASTSINQGQETMIVPIVSSIPYSVTDSLGNLICPRDPSRRVLGYRQIIANFSTASTSTVQVTGLTVPVIVPAGRKIKLTAYCGAATQNASAQNTITIWDGTAGTGTQLCQSNSGANLNAAMTGVVPVTPTSATKTYNAGMLVSSGTGTLNAAATNPTYLMVELI